MDDFKRNGGGAAVSKPSSANKKSPSASPAAAKKVTIKSADMKEDMQKEAIDCALSAFEKLSVEKDIAEHIKKEFDKKHGPTWHCIVGRNFGSYVTHETNHFVYFYLDQKAIFRERGTSSCLSLFLFLAPADMFKKFSSEDLSAQNQVKASVQCKIQQSIADEYPGLEPMLNDLLPKKSPLIVAKCQNHLNLVVLNNVPLFFNVHDGPYMPTLRLLHQYPNIMKKLQVDRGAIKFVLAGANIMCPGLTSPGGVLDDDVVEETPVVIVAEGKQHALAIGFTEMSAKKIRAINKGIGVDNMHYLNDGLWKMERLDYDEWSHLVNLIVKVSCCLSSLSHEFHFSRHPYGFMSGFAFGLSLLKGKTPFTSGSTCKGVKFKSLFTSHDESAQEITSGIRTFTTSSPLKAIRSQV
ncbi:hypothetical protein NE237_014685 [Protea cynaroides]|uniref:PUA domain-containing protein n=1 Tax=Protea cynaroides TaxID=273540 RepID=A0A9Q0KCM3_9MAGN|nr:hypothetical protein NE237_014685 [Protea cynaroides]